MTICIKNIFSKNILKLGLAVSLGVLSGCALNPATGNRDFVMMTESEELAIGRDLHAKVIAQVPLYNNPDLQNYVQKVGREVAAHSHRQELIYRFYVLDDPEINAFALPGGYIYVHRGLLAYLDSEAQLAAVLGHEIAHVTARHAVRQQRNSTLANIFGILAGVYGGSRLFYDLANIGGVALVAGYGRDLELEADRLGAEYLVKSGYPAESMLDVLGVLKNQDEYAQARAKAQGRKVQSYHGLFASHPENDDRLQEVIAESKKLVSQANPTTMPSTGDRYKRGDYLARIDGMTFGESIEQGVQRGQSFYHHDLKIQLRAPENWHLENLPDKIVMIAPEGAGVLVLTSQDLNKRQTPAQFAKANLKLGKIKSEKIFENNGFAIWQAEVNNTGLFSNDVDHLAVFVDQERAWILSSGGKLKDSPAKKSLEMRAPFETVMKSLAILPESERTKAQPLIIQLFTPKDASQTYGILARDQILGTATESILRLINQSYPKGEPILGKTMKTLK